MLKKTVQQGRSKRGGEAYASVREPLSDARTQLADFFSILLGSLEFLEYLPALQQFHRLLQLDILLKRELSSHVSR